MVAGLLERERQHSRSRRSTADLVRLYLQDIGRVDLLSQEEELTLARLVQRR
ncbi:MAG: RNA polymerase sigma factor, RpoD/SigA family, partial [Synechococcaceae bacterium WB4_2_0811]|nr:RNA polymerase sigma factor, RpoD/SigA family [Synechococcaceae bacterium WB4_2_0811]